MEYAQLKTILQGRRLPCALIDVDALDRNLDRHLLMLRGRNTPLRIATKSLRVRAIIARLLERGGAQLRGVMCFAVREAAFLADHGFDDFLVAYPTFQNDDVEAAAALTKNGKTITLVTDSREGLERFSSLGTRQGVRLRTALCVDMSYKPLGGRLHLGVRRSPLHSKEQVLELARFALAQPGIEFRGLLCYEAQIAGLQDANPFDRAMNPAKAVVKQLSIREVRERRSEIVAFLRREGVPLTLVNGGGVGSLDTTTPETGVTEVTAGSGFYKPHLFDYYRAPHMKQFEPAAFFALEVTRRHSPTVVTCLGGGYVASGPPGWDKVPLPWQPSGLKLTADEAAGEVQTPVQVPPEVKLSIGDPIIFRHAKAGELFERFKEALLIQHDRVVDVVPTYRGEGQCFI